MDEVKLDMLPAVDKNYKSKLGMLSAVDSNE